VARARRVPRVGRSEDLEGEAVGCLGEGYWASNKGQARPFPSPFPCYRWSLRAVEGRRVPIANEWQTIKKARSGVRIWPSTCGDWWATAVARLRP
jgi:hypothetical protein